MIKTPRGHWVTLSEVATDVCQFIEENWKKWVKVQNSKHCFEFARTLVSRTYLCGTVLCLVLFQIRSRDRTLGTGTGYGLDDRGVGVQFPVGSGIFSFLRPPDWLWGTPTLLSNLYRGQFPRGTAAWAWSWSFTSNECRDQENVDI
jgi:hypothetical protein